MKLVVWHNLNYDSYYYKIIKGYYGVYEVGYINQYNHEIVLVIDKIYFQVYKPPIKKRVLRKMISFLQKLEKR